MNCKNCGSIINPGDNVCRTCGTVVSQVGVNPPPTVTNQMQGGQSFGQPVQPNMGMQQPMMYQPKKSNNGLIIAIVAVIAVAAIIVVYMVTKDSSSEVTEEPTNEVVTTTDVTYSGYTFKVPNDYTYEISSDALEINNSNNWSAYVGVADGSYDALKVNKNYLKPYFEKQGFTSTEAKIATYGGLEWLIAELSYGGESAIAGYAKASETQTFYIMIYNNSGTADYNALEKISPILKNSKYQGTSHSMATSKFSPEAVMGGVKADKNTTSNTTQNSNVTPTTSNNNITSNVTQNSNTAVQN